MTALLFIKLSLKHLNKISDDSSNNPYQHFTFFVKRGNACMFNNFKKSRQFYGTVKASTEKITKNIGVFCHKFYWDITAL